MLVALQSPRYAPSRRITKHLRRRPRCPGPLWPGRRGPPGPSVGRHSPTAVRSVQSGPDTNAQVTAGPRDRPLPRRARSRQGGDHDVGAYRCRPEAVRGCPGRLWAVTGDHTPRRHTSPYRARPSRTARPAPADRLLRSACLQRAVHADDRYLRTYDGQQRIRSLGPVIAGLVAVRTGPAPHAHGSCSSVRTLASAITWPLHMQRR